MRLFYVISTRKFNPRSDWKHPRYKAVLPRLGVERSQPWWGRATAGLAKHVTQGLSRQSLLFSHGLTRLNSFSPCYGNANTALKFAAVTGYLRSSQAPHTLLYHHILTALACVSLVTSTCLCKPCLTTSSPDENAQLLCVHYFPGLLWLIVVTYVRRKEI